MLTAKDGSGTDTAATSDDQIITFINGNPDVVDLTNPVIRATSTRTETPAACTKDGYTGDEANLGLWLSLAAATLLAGAAWVTLDESAAHKRTPRPLS